MSKSLSGIPATMTTIQEVYAKFPAPYPLLHSRCPLKGTLCKLRECGRVSSNCILISIQIWSPYDDNQSD